MEWEGTTNFPTQTPEVSRPGAVSERVPNPKVSRPDAVSERVPNPKVSRPDAVSKGLPNPKVSRPDAVSEGVPNPNIPKPTPSREEEVLFTCDEELWKSISDFLYKYDEYNDFKL